MKMTEPRHTNPLESQTSSGITDLRFGTSSAQPQQFNGKLQLFSVPEALQMITGGAKSGVLTYKFPNKNLDFHIAVKNGRIVGASGKSIPRLSEALLQLGVPAATVGGLGLELSRTRGSDAHSAIALRRIGHTTLERALELRALAGLLLIWKQTDGEFRFAPSDTPPVTVEPGLAADSLILEVARRIDELETTSHSSVNPTEVYAVAERIGDFSGRINTLAPRDWALLTELDGVQSLAQIARATMRPWDDLMQSVGALETAGLIEPKRAQRGVHHKYAPLAVGQLAPAFSLPALNGSNFSLGGMRGKRTLLAFHRHAGCPFCNLRVHQLIKAHANLERAGVNVVAVFSSSLAGLRERVGTQKPPFTLLADGDDAVHTLYGTNLSTLGMLYPQLLPIWLEGKRLSVKHGAIDGDLTRMPADILIGPDLRIEAAMYARNAAQHIPIATLERWGHTGVYQG
jgi:peroxiredoxin